MSKVNYHDLTNSIAVSFDGKYYNIHSSDGRFTEIKKCISEGRLDAIRDVVKIENFFESQGLKLIDGVVHVDGSPLPEELSDRVIALQEAKEPFQILINLWNNIKANPSFNSRTMLYKFLQHNGHPLTEDGCFIAYRGVTEDFKDVHSKTFDNSVGQVCEMPRDQVDDNPNNTCSNGLHVACYEYANGFGSKLIEVKVNPIDVVCVPADYDGTKMRVCKFEVLAVCERLRTEPVYNTGIEDSGECSACGNDLYNDCDCDLFDE